MRKKCLLIMPVILMTFLVCTGCTGMVKEKDIKEDLRNYEDFLEEGEKIDKVVLEKRDTDKEQNEDTIWCVITTQDSKIAYEKETILYYHKYDKGGWLLDEVEVESSNEWKITPLKGIEEQDIPSTLDGIFVQVDGEPWEILESEVDELSINKRETDIEEKTDEVTMTFTLKGKVEKVKGKLIINYIFEDKWEIDKVLEAQDFVVEAISEKALNVGENELIEKLTQETISYGGGASLQQEIAIAKEELSDFKIDKQESKEKGTEQSIYCSCALNKMNVVLELQMIFFYSYSESWELSRTDVTAETKSLDILGKWSGESIRPGKSDQVVLDINEVEGNKIIGVYYFTPDEITNFSQAGSYNVSGTIDEKTLNMELTAGDWIEQPKQDAFMRQDITAVINVDMGIIEGTGHHGYVFRVEKQD